MTIFHLISGGETGGSKNHLLSLLSQFPKDEIVLGIMQKGELATEAMEAGIRTVVFEQKSRYDFNALRKIKHFLRTENIEIVHTHGPRANLFISLVRQSFKFKWVTTIHSDPEKDFVKGGVKGRVFTMINMRVIRKIDHFFAVSHRFKEMLVNYGIAEDRITVIYNGISFEEPVHESIDRPEIRLESSDFVVIMIARLHPIKNHSLALKAVKMLQDKKVPIKLLLVGDGSERRRIEAQIEQLGIKSSVQLLGFRKDIHALLKLSDVCLLTSDSESFPLVLLEAARASVPIVTTDVGGVNRLVSGNRFGRLVDVGDVEGVKNALEELFQLKTSGELTKIGSELFDFARENFSIEQLYILTSKTYKSL